MEYVCDSLFGLLSRIMLISDMVVTLFIHVCHDHETTLKSVPVQCAVKLTNCSPVYAFSVNGSISFGMFIHI